MGAHPCISPDDFAMNPHFSTASTRNSTQLFLRPSQECRRLPLVGTCSQETATQDDRLSGGQDGVFVTPSGQHSGGSMERFGSPPNGRLQLMRYILPRFISSCAAIRRASRKQCMPPEAWRRKATASPRKARLHSSGVGGPKSGASMKSATLELTAGVLIWAACKDGELMGLVIEASLSPMGEVTHRRCASI